ncbi:MAG: Nif3-like dinuclear metal center hexameric protein [Bacteroidales bacterium]|nr:Nif3-like dinuclear metal center hexameric protein [Bacteroidales bacterium]
MTKVSELIAYLEDLFPLALQESYDRSGAQILFTEEPINGILLCLDITEKVIDEALEKTCNIIICHHPILFKPIYQIRQNLQQSDIIIKAISNKISIYALHTNFDNSWQGTNRILTELLELKNVQILLPMENQLMKLVTFVPHTHVEYVRQALFDAGAGHIGNYDSCSYNIEGYGTFRGNEEANPFVGEKGQLHQEPETRIETIFPVFKTNQIIQALLKAHPYEEVAYDLYPLSNKYYRAGSGMIGYLHDPMSKEAFLWYVKERIGSNILKYNHCIKDVIQKVAVCSGSGSSLIPKVLQEKADAFITSDISYHNFIETPSQLLLIDAGHYETEIHFTKKIFEIITKKNTNFAVHLSESCLNPVNYY